MSELKTALKEAKNAIKQKDLDAAMGHCKAALKIDRKNYQALAIFGKICQDMNKFEDSKKSLLLATQIEPDQPIAWQGLATLHEKDPKIFSPQEAATILSHLASITTEEEKYESIIRRLANVHQENNLPLEAADALKMLTKRLTDEKRQQEVWKSIVQLLSGIKDPSIEALNKLIEAIENCLNDAFLGENESNYQLFLQSLYKAQRYSDLTIGAEKMALIFPTAYPLEWIARVFVEDKTGYLPDGTEEVFSDDTRVAPHVTKLLSLYQKSPWGNSAQGLLLTKLGNHREAMGYFRTATEKSPKNILPWNLLLQSQKKLSDYPGIEASCRRLISILDNEGGTLPLPRDITDAASFRHDLLLTQASVLFEMGHDNHLKKAIDILEKEPNKNMDCATILIKSRIQLGDLEAALQDLEEFMSSFGNCVDGQILQAYILREKGQREEARQLYEAIIKNVPDSAQALFELGRIQFEDKEYQKALICFLKAAKHDPKLSSAFLYLGHYYRLQDNMDKARKCYEKSLSLNPCGEEAGAALSDIYRFTGDYNSNLELLSQVTNQSGRSGGGWAWLRLGLHHMSQESFEDAVRALQCAVEINPKDSVGYECLGDAYLARGSHTAAMKVFTRAAELSNLNGLYPKCQIARIKHLVGEHLESIFDYEKVLADQPPKAIRIVALIGLAEVLLSRAKKYRQAQLLLNLREDCLYAIQCLCRAANEKANNCTIWKLLGEACTLQASIPPSLCRFEVPSRLFDPTVGSQQDTRVLDKQELLQLGARCLGVGIQIAESNDDLWHDLGVNLFLQGWCKLNTTTGVPPQYKQEEEKGKSEEEVFIADCFSRSVSCLKRSLTLNPSCQNAWNSLGVVCFFKGDHEFAQHAFIQSLQIRPTVEAWTHLGLLYFKRDIHLAHEAFSHAQALDPGYVACWVGQAIVAERIGHYEAFDLFRHTTLLGINPESCIGYGHYVMDRICGQDAKEGRDLQSLIPTAGDCLQFYSREKEQDIIGQNMCGLILEMMGLQEGALSAFTSAVQMLEVLPSVPVNLKDNIYFNHCRVLTSLGRIDEAMKQYTKIKEPDFYSHCGRALALLKGGEFEEAYQNYSSAIYWLAPDEVQKSHALVALAFLQYKFKKIEDVKTLLFQSSCIEGGSVEGLLALTSLGLIQGDATLTDAALAELKPHTNSKEYAHHIAFLLAAQASIKGDKYKAKLILSRAAHCHPENAGIWRSLSQHLLTATPEELRSPPPASARAAAASASSARTLSQASGEDAKVSQDVVMKAMAFLKASSPHPPPAGQEPPKKKGSKASGKKGSAKKTEDKKEPRSLQEEEQKKAASLLEAQRAVLMCPADPESWAILIAALKVKPQASKLARVWMTKSKPNLSSWLQAISAS